MSRRFYLILACALVLVTMANAQPVTYQLQDVTFLDGGSATGTFVFNPTTGVYSNVNVITTTGGARTGATYNFVCGQDVPSCESVNPATASIVAFLTSNAANQTSNPVLKLAFTTPLAATGGPFGLDVAVEGTCAISNCGDVVSSIRESFSGEVVIVTPPGAFQVRYVANLHSGTSFVDIVNTGASATASAGFITGGNICVQVYAFDNSEELLACCTCTITPNGLASIEVDDTAAGLYGNTETGAAPSSGVIKLVATVGGTGCVATAERPLVPGMAAWGTTLHNVEIPAGTVTSNFQLTETPFTQTGLSQDEYDHLTTFCQFDQVNGTGQGVCPGCKLTGLGASSSQ